MSVSPYPDYPLFVITPTGGRPEAFARLVDYINAQTYTRFVWLIVDDCDPATKLSGLREGQYAHVIRPSWRWQPGQNTQAKCLAEALRRVPDDACVAVMEDDDHYGPDHLVRVMWALEDVDLVGEAVSHYYNVATRRCKAIPSKTHASLCSVGVKGPALQLLRQLCEQPARHIDIELWKQFQGRKDLHGTHNVTGIKGLPGRGGLGIGHRQDFGAPDPDGAVLREWIGDDADLYLNKERAA